jgi:hypothetical protein
MKDLPKLINAIELLVHQDTFGKTVNELQEALSHSTEPFLWSVIDLNSIKIERTQVIKSCRIFECTSVRNRFQARRRVVMRSEMDSDPCGARVAGVY